MRIFILLFVMAIGISAQAGTKLENGYYAFVKMESTIPSELNQVLHTRLKHCTLQIKNTLGGSVKVSFIDGGKDHHCTYSSEDLKYKIRKDLKDTYEYGWEKIAVKDKHTFVYYDTNSPVEIFFTFKRVEQKPAKATLIKGFGRHVCDTYGLEKNLCDIDGVKVPFKEVTLEMLEKSSYCEQAKAKALVKAVESCQKIYPNQTCEYESAEMNIDHNFRYMLGRMHYCDAYVFVRAK